MKSGALISLLIIGVGYAFVGCKGPAGPQGPPGEDKTANCFTCHTDNPFLDQYEIRAKHEQWEMSKHASGENSDHTSTDCRGCHTGQGFVDRITPGDTIEVTEPDVIGCFTCHSPHTYADSTNPFKPRTDAPVSLMVPSTGATFNYGEGNLCANCHQARFRTPDVHTIADGDSFTLSSQYWGPHNATQANILYGIGGGGYEFPGWTYNNSFHTTAVLGEGCPICHMFEPDTLYKVKAGGHTWEMRYESEGVDTAYTESCNVSACHGAGGITTFDRVTGEHPQGVGTEIDVLLDSLAMKLVAGGLLDTSGGEYHAVTGVYYKASELRALHNLLLVDHEGSHAVHNTKYAFDLIESSLAVLDTLTLAPPRREEIARKR